MKRYIFLLPILFFSTLVFGQSDIKEDFYDAEFFLAEEEYEEAWYAFNKVYKRGYEDNANINYRLGVCLLNIPGRKTEAAPFLEKAILNITEKYKEGSFKEEMAPPDAIVFLGNAYRINNELDKAIEQYNSFKKYLSEKDTYQMEYLEKQIESCENARKAEMNPVDYSKGNLGQLIQTAENKFNPAVSGNLQTFAFMGKHKFYNGVYVAKKVGDKWAKPLNITPSIQSDGNQNVLSINQDGTKILLAWNDEFDSDIYITEWLNNRWTNSEPLGRPINSKFFESHACFSPDEQSIYFTSNRGESLGGMDIFRSDRMEDGSWGDAVNLGDVINSTLNEETPFISPEGNRLYFSSQGHNTIGGYDIFYSELQSDGSWGVPINLGSPLNTTDDDLAFAPIAIEGEEEIYMFAKGEEGQKDLFKFDIIPTGSLPVVVAFDEAEAEEILAEEIAEEIVEEIIEEIVEEIVEIEEYSIKPIFFGFDSYSLNAESKQKLDDFAKLLLKYPDLKVESIGYTDALGSFEYNSKLSKKRAGAVSDYLASKGISEDRLSVTAMSENDPIAINRTADDRDSPEGRQLNRRVQFRISMTSASLIFTEIVDVPDHLKIK